MNVYQYLIKNGQVIALIVGLVVVAAFIISAFVGLNNSGIAYSTNLNDLDKEVVNEITAFNLGLALTIVLVILTALSWLVFGVWGFVRNPKKSMKAAIPFVILAVLFLILFSVSQPEKTGSLYETIQEFKVSDSASKYISGALLTTLLLAGIAVLSLVYSEIRNVLK